MQNIYTDELFSIAQHNLQDSHAFAFCSNQVCYLHGSSLLCEQLISNKKILESKTGTWLPKRKFNGKMHSIPSTTLLLVILIYYEQEMKSTKQDYTQQDKDGVIK